MVTARRPARPGTLRGSRHRRPAGRAASSPASRPARRSPRALAPLPRVPAASSASRGWSPWPSSRQTTPGSHGSLAAHAIGPMRFFHSRYDGSGSRDTTRTNAYRPAPSLRRYRSSALRRGRVLRLLLPGRRRVFVFRVAKLVGAVGAEGDQVRIGRLGELGLHGDVVLESGRERVPAQEPGCASCRSALSSSLGKWGISKRVTRRLPDGVCLASDRGSVAARPAIAAPDASRLVEPMSAKTPRALRAETARQRRPRAPARPASSAGSDVTPGAGHRVGRR